MANNIRKIKQDLRAYAKRCKDVHYTESLLITFLISGMLFVTSNLFSAPTDTNIENQRQAISTSIKSLNQQVKATRKENDKLLKNTNLELIQLMEQGDHVIKSPWSSWQYGMNYFNSNWNGTYKGRGDKEEKYPYEGMFERSLSSFERYTSPLSRNYGNLALSSNRRSASSNARTGVSSSYGIASNDPAQEPIVEMNVEASIRPKTVAIEIPNLGIQAPTLNALAVNGAEPRAVTVPKPIAPTISVNLPEPNANPFANYCFTGCSYTVERRLDGNFTKEPHAGRQGSADYDGNGENLWSGVDINGNPVSTAGVGPTELSASTGRQGILTYLNDSVNVNHKGGYYFGNVNLYIKGGDSINDKVIGWSSSKKVAGQIGLHTVADGTLHDIKAYLYGQAAFHSIETWHAGHNTYNNVNVNIKGGTDNTVFLIYPAAWETLILHTTPSLPGTRNKRGEFNGTVNVTFPENSSRNIIYNALGVQAAFKIESGGDYILEGQGNMVYSGYGYSPNYQNLVGKTYTGYDGGTRTGVIEDPSGTGTGMIPYINLTKPVQSYGDDNIILYFGNKTKNAANDPYQEERTGGANSVAKWQESIVGIYQGEIRAKAVIGNQLNEASTAQQTNTTVVGSVTNYGGNKLNGDNKYVETNVGIFARSGQRTGISPFRDLGAPAETTGATTSMFDHDTIHALQVNDVDIQFGKYSKSGIMIASEYGTQIDVAEESNNKKIIPVMSGPIKDYGSKVGAGKISADDSVNEAASGTIIAYANGVWDNSKHQMSSNTESNLKNLPSTINIGKDVEMTGRYLMTGGTAGTSTETGVNPIAYYAKNGGLINAKGKTDAKGFYSIIGFADGTNSKVETTGLITAIDEWVTTDNATKPYRYKNIAALAKDGGLVNTNGGVKIAGIAGFADGVGSIVNINTANNNIQTGTDPALIALGGGKVNFAGGNIYQEDKASSGNVVTAGTSTVDHSKSVPFYADSSTSAVNFTAGTNIYIANGILMTGEDTDYEGTTPVTGSKYHGMNNVTVHLSGDNSILRTYQGKTTNWTGSGAGLAGVKQDMKLANLYDHGHDYKIYYIDGTFNLLSNQDLDANDEFNTKIGLSNEDFTINSGVTVSSATGKGLSMASHSGTTANTSTKYTNKGTINITGGSSSSTTALSVSYGIVDNQGTVNVDNGIGAYGINGSSLTNNSTINITSSGVGMAAFASASALKDYGTDAKMKAGASPALTPSDKVLEIVNNGTITVAGNQSIGLYGKTNSVTGAAMYPSASNAVITNNGKIIMTGDGAVGIDSDATGGGNGATVNLGGTGSSDIVVGTSGIGVYAGNGSIVNFLGNTGVEVKDKGVGLFIDGSSSLNSAGNTFEIKYTGSSSGSGAGIFYSNSATNSTNVNIVNNGSDKGVVGLYTTGGTLTNNGTITDKSGKAYGIYAEGANVINSGTLTIGNKGKGILSTGGDVTLTNSSVITLGENEAIGVYTKGSGNKITADAGSKLTIGNSSYGFINEGTGNTITSNMTSQSVGDNTVFVFSRDTSGTVINNTPLTSTGSLNYGLYSAGNVENDADINFASGIGNVGIYSINGGTAVNKLGRTITVGASSSDPTANQYAIGMAAGYAGDATTSSYTGNIENRGVINVTGEYSIGMYGTQRGTTVTNNGTINLNASNTTGMYLDNGAYGINNGTIKSNGTGLKKVVGVVVKNGSTIENHGEINITATDAAGILSKGNAAGQNPGIIKNYGTFVINGTTSNVQFDSETEPEKAADPFVKLPEAGKDIEKDMAGIKIHAPSGSSEATITVNGVPVVPELATTTAQEYKPMEVSTIGMYIDTSSKRFTTPVVGLNNLKTLTNADLIIGTEAAQNTTGKYIKISQQILSPYNEVIKDNPQIEKWNIYSGSLTWMASVAQNQTDGTIENAYLAKIPYTKWAGTGSTPVNSTDTYNFLDGLEQRYGAKALGSREKLLFDKISGIGNNEEILFYQATDEMMGHQYGNLQQRINATGNILDKEFRYLKHDWRNPSKQNNKIKVFGMRDEYNTDTAGIIDYTSNAYGVAYVHENEKIKMGNSSGWYAGAVTNRFKFKDIGHSRENQTILKAGLFKTMSPAGDHNGALQWTIGGDVFVGINDMKRRYLVVDEIFQAKSDYHSYGAALKTDLGYDIRMSERTHLRPYGALKLEYGRFNSIKEDRGEMRLEIDGNDYFSVKPEVGVEFRYVQPLAVRTNLTVGLSAAYENELGKVGDVNNEGRVRYTNADWFGIRGEKEDRKGNGKFDLNIGVDNTRFGVTVNGGYDTKGKNVRGGIGFRAIY